jgi:large subunit ribosomal protein L29
MQASDLRLLTERELEVRLEEGYENLFKLRQSWFMGSLEDNSQLTAAKRDIARIKTIMRERELAKMMVEGDAQ